MRTTAEHLRQLFNENGYWEGARGFLYRQAVRWSNCARPEKITGEPPCTHSQKVSYYDQQGAKIATVHQYLRCTGEVGASGRPDPKYLLHEGTVYWVP